MKIMPGMRTVKTAVAVGLSVAASYALKLEYPFYAAIACVVVLQIYSQDTIVAGRNRLLGTLAGGLIACLFAYIPVNKSITSFLGIILLFVILSNLKLNRSMTIAGIVFMRVMVDLDYSQETPFLFTYNRMLATFVGVLIAVAVNLLLFPYHRTCENDQRFVLLRAHLFDGIADMLGRRLPVDIAPLCKDCDTLQMHLEKNSAEYKLFARREAQVEEMRKAVDCYRRILRHMEMIEELPAEHRCLDEPNSQRFFRLIGGGLQENQDVPADSAPTVVYNYHAGRILDDVEQADSALARERLWPPQNMP